MQLLLKHPAKIDLAYPGPARHLGDRQPGVRIALRHQLHGVLHQRVFFLPVTAEIRVQASEKFIEKPGGPVTCPRRIALPERVNFLEAAANIFRVVRVETVDLPGRKIQNVKVNDNQFIVGGTALIVHVGGQKSHGPGPKLHVHTAAGKARVRIYPEGKSTEVSPPVLPMHLRLAGVLQPQHIQ